MELILLDQYYEPSAVIDVFESLIWTDRYIGYGDFELYTSLYGQATNYIKHNSVLLMNGSESGMITEDIKIVTDLEAGTHIIFSGRSFESILERRIIWNQTIIESDLQTAILKLLNENIINPADPARKIDNFIFEATNDTSILSISVSEQFRGEYVYDAIKSLCETHSIGFKVILNDNKQFVFSLYSGIDRSYSQIDNPYVVFSPSYDNLLGSNYEKSVSSLRNVVLVAGEGEGSEKKTASYGSESGLSRREMYTDASDVSTKTGDVTLTEVQYIAELQNKGKNVLAENEGIETFDGEIDYGRTYIYGVDYFIGDVVQVENEYGLVARSRVTELIHSQSESGLSIYPTFRVVN